MTKHISSVVGFFLFSSYLFVLWPSVPAQQIEIFLSFPSRKSPCLSLSLCFPPLFTAIQRNYRPAQLEIVPHRLLPPLLRGTSNSFQKRFFLCSPTSFTSAGMAEEDGHLHWWRSQKPADLSPLLAIDGTSQKAILEKFASHSNRSGLLGGSWLNGVRPVVMKRL